MLTALVKLSKYTFYVFFIFVVFFQSGVSAANYDPVVCPVSGCSVSDNLCIGCQGNSAWCDPSTQLCHFTCTNCGCPSPGGWGPCVDGYETQSCGGQIHQIRYCGPRPTGPGGSPAPTPPPPPAPSCTIDISASYSPISGGVLSVSPVITSVASAVNQVDFVVAGTSVATVCANGSGPCTAGSGSYIDSSSVFNADLTGVATGSTTLTVTGRITSLGITCTDTAVVNVTNASSWWQVIGGDVISGNTAGSVQSVIPVTCVLASCSPVLVKDDSMGFSGVVSTGTGGAGAISIGTGSASTANWRVTGGGFLSTEGYNYTYFKRKIPDGCAPQVLSGSSINATTFNSGGATGGACGDYFWYGYNSATPPTITGVVDLGNRKVIAFFEGSDMTLNADINFNNGVGAFYLFSERDITIAGTVGDPAVTAPNPDIEGVLFAGDQIIIPSAGASSDPQLHIRGAVVGLGTNGVNDGIDANRVLPNNGLFPAEVFEFGPDLIMNWPSSLTRRTLQWREVAP